MYRLSYEGSTGAATSIYWCSKPGPFVIRHPKSNKTYISPIYHILQYLCLYLGQKFLVYLSKRGTKNNMLMTKSDITDDIVFINMINWFIVTSILCILYTTYSGHWLTDQWLRRVCQYDSREADTENIDHSLINKDSRRKDPNRKSLFK